jgi:N utilization substance protein B
MINRRIIRVKVFQALYAYAQSGNAAMSKYENELMRSIDKLYDLYILLLQLPVELAKIEERKQEEAKNKILPTYEDLNPNTKFLENKVVKLLEINAGLNKEIKERKINWAPYQDELNKFYRVFKQSDVYDKYMNSGRKGFKEDKDFVEFIFSKLFSEYDLLIQTIEESSIYWSEDDLDYVLSMVIKHIRKFNTSSDEFTKIAYKFNDTEEDITFIKNLFRRTIGNDEELAKIIAEHTENWDVERIAVTDFVILKMALTELMYMPSVPVKVSMNEYIELAKNFSTPKSQAFVNGLLDKMVKDLKEQGKIQKAGRGLVGGL